MTIWEHLEELRERALVSFGSVAALILVAFCFSKDLVIFLEQPVASTVSYTRRLYCSSCRGDAVP